MKYVQIEEIILPGVPEMIPRAEWNAAEIEAGQSARSRDLHINSGTLMIEMLVRPFERGVDQMGQPVTRQKAVDFARMRQVMKPLEVLDADGDGVCDLALGTYVELDDAWWDLIWEQAQIYPWVFTGRKPIAVLQEMLGRWEKATDTKPLVIEEVTTPGDRWNPTTRDLVRTTLEANGREHLIGSTD